MSSNSVFDPIFITAQICSMQCTCLSFHFLFTSPTFLILSPLCIYKVSSISPWEHYGVSIIFCLVLRYHWIVSSLPSTLILWPFRDGLKRSAHSFVPLLVPIFSAWSWNDRKNVWILHSHCIFFIRSCACFIRYKTSVFVCWLSIQTKYFLLIHAILSYWIQHLSHLGWVSFRVGVVVDSCSRFCRNGYPRRIVMR